MFIVYFQNPNMIKTYQSNITSLWPWSDLPLLSNISILVHQVTCICWNHIHLLIGYYHSCYNSKWTYVNNLSQFQHNCDLLLSYAIQDVLSLSSFVVFRYCHWFLNMTKGLVIVMICCFSFHLHYDLSSTVLSLIFISDQQFWSLLHFVVFSFTMFCYCLWFSNLTNSSGYCYVLLLFYSPAVCFVTGIDF